MKKPVVPVSPKATKPAAKESKSADAFKGAPFLLQTSATEDKGSANVQSSNSSSTSVIEESDFSIDSSMTEDGNEQPSSHLTSNDKANSTESQKREQI